MPLITIGGMIGVGKTTAAKVISEHLGSELYLESVKGNTVLKKFYSASPEEIEKKRYPFLLQLSFLNSRFSDIKNALTKRNAVLDRSIYEDWYFAKVNTDLGRISKLEFNIYENLLGNMMEELNELPQKSPDVFVFLDASFDTIISRIAKRNRSFEQDDSLRDYFYKLWSGYRDWVENVYDKSPVIVFNTEEHDLNHKASRELLRATVDEQLALGIK